MDVLEMLWFNLKFLDESNIFYAPCIYDYQQQGFSLPHPRFTYRVLIKYCVFFEKFRPLSDFPRCQCVYTGFHDAWTVRWQVEHQRSSRTCRVQKHHNKEKTQYLINTLYFLLIFWRMEQYLLAVNLPSDPVSSPSLGCSVSLLEGPLVCP